MAIQEAVRIWGVGAGEEGGEREGHRGECA